MKASKEFDEWLRSMDRPIGLVFVLIVACVTAIVIHVVHQVTA